LEIIGSIDRRDEALIAGWSMSPDTAGTRLAVEFLLGDHVIGCCVADRFRQDLKDADLGDGYSGFAFSPPPFLPKSEIRKIAVRVADSDVFLPLHAAIEADGPATAARSRFGGLWIDREDWLDRLALKHRNGEISEALSVAIFRFLRDGYVVLEQAVPAARIDRLNAAIDQAWVAPPPGLLIHTFGPDGRYSEMPPELAAREDSTKLVDLHAHCRAAREAIASAPVVEFLTAVFEDQPKAFQSLTFWKGSQQAIHKDTAYVKVDSDPLHFAASWLALEDIEAGTGELEYYVGSHRAPDYVFNQYNKWMGTYVSEHDRFLASLHDDAASLKHAKSAFLAKKGDVLIWHADLAHGGSKIVHPERTRRSLVTHFTPARDEPYYRRDTQYAQVELQGCRFVSEFVDIGPTTLDEP
jgi:phytanoyl-CoA hydroxylase